jgi:hypothetical protein
MDSRLASLSQNKELMIRDMLGWQARGFDSERRERCGREESRREPVGGGSFEGY